MIKLVELLNNAEKIKRNNDLCEELKTSEPSIDWDNQKLENINDEFCPYKLWLKELLEDKSMKLIEDTMEIIENVYISNLNWEHQLKSLTDYKFVNKYGEFNYGVCDNASQLLEYCNEKIDEDPLRNEKEYIIVMTPIFKHNQGEYGWRWHKWGKYIGIQNPKCEHLAEEEGIDMVYVFQVKEVSKEI